MDLISRQLVIKTLCERRCGNKPKGCPSGFCTESLAVDCIPSAQDDVPDKNVGDMVSRQAVQEMVDRIGDMYPYRQIGNRDSYSQYNEAWTDAINRVDAELNSLPSVQPESCGDVISREYLKEHIEACWINGRPRHAPELKELLSWVDDVPSAQQWIPCSERLPETNGRYIVTRGLKACNAIWNRVYIINYSDLMGLKAEKIWWDGNVGKSDFQKIDDVIAWKPLPEPYKGEQE